MLLVYVSLLGVIVGGKYLPMAPTSATMGHKSRGKEAKHKAAPNKKRRKRIKLSTVVGLGTSAICSFVLPRVLEHTAGSGIPTFIWTILKMFGSVIAVVAVVFLLMLNFKQDILIEAARLTWPKKPRGESAAAEDGGKVMRKRKKKLRPIR